MSQTTKLVLFIIVLSFNLVSIIYSESIVFLFRAIGIPEPISSLIIITVIFTSFIGFIFFLCRFAEMSQSFAADLIKIVGFLYIYVLVVVGISYPFFLLGVPLFINIIISIISLFSLVFFVKAMVLKYIRKQIERQEREYLERQKHDSIEDKDNTKKVMIKGIN